MFIVVGEPIVAPYNSYGDPSFVRLPHTGYLVYISDLYWQTGHPDDERLCVSQHRNDHKEWQQ